MPICSRCRTEVGLLGRLNFNSQTGRCGKCENEVKRAYDYFRQLFINFCQDGVLSPQEWTQLQDVAQQYQLDWHSALTYVRGDALNFMERLLAFAAADGIITDEEDAHIHNWQLALNLPNELMQPILGRLNYLKEITRIKEGKLPIVKPELHLESDESCHLDMGSIYNKVNAKSITHISGRLVATDKKLHFLSPSGGWEIQWKRIMRIERYNRGVYLELSTKKGNGQYDVTDPMYAEAVLTTIVKMSKREMVASYSDLASRHIPQNIRSAVWQRDQGKCVQCGEASYLEFDHIIPFSKGGASTVGNVQLLCRRCNLSKGNRL